MTRNLPKLPAGAGAILPTVWVTFVTTVVLALAFSFGNVWDLGKRLGVESHIASLIGPAVDLTAAGLLVVVPWLVLAGVPTGRLRSARQLMALSAAITLALNSAPSAIAGWTRGDARAWGLAIVEAIVPLLLMAWSHVGPSLIASFVEVREAHRDRLTEALRTTEAEASRLTDERDAEIVAAVSSARVEMAAELAEVAAQRDLLDASLRAVEERHAADREDAAAAVESLRAELAEVRLEARRRPVSGAAKKPSRRAPRRSEDEWVELAKERLPEWQIETPVGSVIGSALDLSSAGTISKIRQRLEADRVAVASEDTN